MTVPDREKARWNGGFLLAWLSLPSLRAAAKRSDPEQAAVLSNGL